MRIKYNSCPWRSKQSRMEQSCTPLSPPNTHFHTPELGSQHPPPLRRWYAAAAAQKHPEAAFNLGVIFHDEKNDPAAMGWFFRAAELGNGIAAYNLGVTNTCQLCAHSHKITCMHEHTHKYMHAQVAHALGRHGMPKDLGTAKHWYLQVRCNTRQDRTRTRTMDA